MSPVSLINSNPRIKLTFYETGDNINLPLHQIHFLEIKKVDSPLLSDPPLYYCTSGNSCANFNLALFPLYWHVWKSSEKYSAQIFLFNINMFIKINQIVAEIIESKFWKILKHSLWEAMKIFYSHWFIVSGRLLAIIPGFFVSVYKI